MSEPLFGDSIYLDDASNPLECGTCEGDGFILACPDDICQAAGVCIHGDGDAICPECRGASAL